MGNYSENGLKVISTIKEEIRNGNFEAEVTKVSLGSLSDGLTGRYEEDLHDNISINAYVVEDTIRDLMIENGISGEDVADGFENLRQESPEIFYDDNIKIFNKFKCRAFYINEKLNDGYSVRQATDMISDYEFTVFNALNGLNRELTDFDIDQVTQNETAVIVYVDNMDMHEAFLGDAELRQVIGCLEGILDLSRLKAYAIGAKATIVTETAFKDCEYRLTDTIDDYKIAYKINDYMLTELNEDYCCGCTDDIDFDYDTEETDEDCDLFEEIEDYDEEDYDEAEYDEE